MWSDLEARALRLSEAAEHTHREWFDTEDGYGLRRLGKIRNEDLDRLRSRLWRLRHPERCAEHRRRWSAKRMAENPAKERARRREAKRRWLAKRPGLKQQIARANYYRRKQRLGEAFLRDAVERARRWYQAAKTDPERIARLRAYKKAWARARKADPAFKARQAELARLRRARLTREQRARINAEQRARYARRKAKGRA